MRPSKPKVCRHHPNSVYVPDVGYDTPQCLACLRRRPAEGAHTRRTRSKARDTEATDARFDNLRDGQPRRYPEPNR